MSSWERARRARETYKPVTAEKMRLATAQEKALAEIVKGRWLEDRQPFDVVTLSNAIEVKCIIEGETGKVTMHPESLLRKREWAQEQAKEPHTVVFDEKTGKIYHKPGVGSYRLSAMKEITVKDLGTLLCRETATRYSVRRQI